MTHRLKIGLGTALVTAFALWPIPSSVTPVASAQAPDVEGPRGAPDADPRPWRSAFVVYEELALAAADGGRSEIEQFVEAYLQRTVAFASGPSVRTRLVKAELAFRAGAHSGISDVEIATAWNRAVIRMGAPSFMRTTPRQLELLTSTLHRRIPNLALMSGDEEGAASTSTSPVHAAFVITFLATQKMMNGAYQVDADRWVRDTQHCLKVATLFKDGARCARPRTRWALPAFIASMLQGHPSDTNMLTPLVHGLLDDIRVAR
jgi:hypothetical protein